MQAKKQAAFSRICATYATSQLSSEDIGRVLQSVADSNNFLQHNAVPVTQMLETLKLRFDPHWPDNHRYSLQIGRGGDFRGGAWKSGHSYKYSMGSSKLGGAKLSHNHSTQYQFVLQTLYLWREISQHMEELWYKADLDLLLEDYRLVNTGQGLNRLQQCPRVAEAMHRILNKVKGRCGSWVGLSVVHLGDRDVPNALTFIDKYTQIPKILTPIYSCINKIEEMKAKESTAHFLKVTDYAPNSNLLAATLDSLLLLGSCTVEQSVCR